MDGNNRREKEGGLAREKKKIWGAGMGAEREGMA